MCKILVHEQGECRAQRKTYSQSKQQIPKSFDMTAKADFENPSMQNV
jgi:hypothetical protein